MPAASSSSCAGTKVIILNNHIMNLMKSPSGALVIALKNDFLDGIQKDIDLNSSSKIIIKDTESGRLSLQFTPDKKEFDIDRTMVLKNIQPDCLCFKGNNNVLKLIKEATSGLLHDTGYFCSQCDKLQQNAILRETPSGVTLVIPTKPLKLIKKKLVTIDRSPETYSKVKILFLDNTVIQFPGVLKSTSSHNYILTVDKEFEKNFQETVKTVIKDDTAISATLRKSTSDCYLVKLGCDIAPHANVAILNKTTSGNIKVIVNDSNTGNLRAGMGHDSPEVKNLTKCVIDLLKKLNNRNTYHTTICQKPYTRYEPFVYHEISNETKDTFENRLKSNVTEKSKAIFLDRLKKYLTNPSKSLLLRKTTSDKSILVIKRGSIKNPLVIKITSSMNIYLLRNEQNRKKNILVQCSLFNLINGDAFAKTHINSKLVGSDAYFTSSELLDMSKSLSDSSQIDCNAGQHIIVKEEITPEDYPESPLSSTSDSIESEKILQYIVIKPAPKLSCLYHTDTYNASSLDELPYASDNDKIRGIDLSTENPDNISGWDSLSFLPPQLPSFLGDVKHLYT